MQAKTFLQCASFALCAMALDALAQPAAAPPSDATAAEATAEEVTKPEFERDPPKLAERGIPLHAGGLTADKTAARALAVSSTVQEKLAELNSANLRIRQTTLQYMPQLILSASYTRLSPVSSSFSSGALVGATNSGLLETGPCPTGGGECVLDSGGQPVGAAGFNILPPNDNYALSATLSIPLSDYALRISHANAAITADNDAKRYAVEAEKLAVTTQARILYHNWLRTQLQVSIAEEALRRNKSRHDDIKLAFEVGSTSKADVLRIENLVASAELTLGQARTAVLLANGQLAVIMSDPSGRLYKPAQGVERINAPAPIMDDAGRRRVVSQAQARRLELKSIQASIKALRKGATSVRAAAYPRVEAVGDVLYANPNQRYFPPRNQWNATWSVGVVATWNVFDSFLNKAKGDEFDSDAQATVARERTLKAAVAQEVITAYVDVERARLAQETSAKQLRLATDAYEMTTRLYAAGRATTTDLIGTETDLVAAQLTAVNAQVDLKIAMLQLRHAEGRDVKAGTVR